MDFKENVVISFAIIALSILDSIFTLHILTLGGTEINPAMLALMDIGDVVFIAGKFSITAVMVMFLNSVYTVKFLNIIKVSWIMKTILAGYILLVGYESYLIHWINTM